MHYLSYTYVTEKPGGSVTNCDWDKSVEDKFGKGVVNITISHISGVNYLRFEKGSSWSSSEKTSAETLLTDNATGVKFSSSG
ncbi:uncharacterized protein I303_103904 [Kwoniella dejecticola CBS 10117]|uniref:Uncharacterized protein n=1 Tax=Kwoniella dejecticola CBS 10117 TaxID=1296121 RepID=A0A1A6A815_9TREE|nr:uncharacterized protein I303_03923 [Kwoniella dejecticola CBS 10117]OBR86203.1 hypothetical protein I303_03923 [Kwoniella dejecticola CBS 10117]